MKIVFVTSHKEKWREASKILSEHEVIAKKIELPELQAEPEEIVKEKAKIAAEQLGMPALVDDVSLCFKALNGLPGPYIKDFLAKLGREGIVKLLSGYEDKSATVICVLGYCEPGKEPTIFKASLDGKIVDPRGETRFGFDPMFLPDGHTKTFAELGIEEKNKISHRRIALEKLHKFLTKA